MLAQASMGAPAEGMGWQKEGSGKRGLYLGLALGWMGVLWYSFVCYLTPTPVV
jgi:hypothetical protein